MTKRNFKHEPSVRLNIILPRPLAERINELLTDPVTKKPEYGARSRLITTLLTEWVVTIEKKLKEKRSND